MQENELLQEQNDVDSTSIRSSMLTIFRGHRFVTNLNKLIDSTQAMRNIEVLSQRNCELKIDTLSYRTLHHWDSIGLIECQRESGSGWRRFNLVEAIWVHVIIELRNMGISLNSISKVKSIFFEKIPGSHLKFFDYYLIDDDRIPDMNLEGLFRMQDLLRGDRANRGEELAQLGDSLLFVQLVLVGFLNFGVQKILAE